MTVGWSLAGRVNASRRHAASQMIPGAEIIARTFALEQALPAALNGDQASLEDGLREYS